MEDGGCPFCGGDLAQGVCCLGGFFILEALLQDEEGDE